MKCDAGTVTSRKSHTRGAHMMQFFWVTHLQWLFQLSAYWRVSSADAGQVSSWMHKKQLFFQFMHIYSSSFKSGLNLTCRLSYRCNPWSEDNQFMDSSGKFVQEYLPPTNPLLPLISLQFSPAAR